MDAEGQASRRKLVNKCLAPVVDYHVVHPRLRRDLLHFAPRERDAVQVPLEPPRLCADKVDKTRILVNSLESKENSRQKMHACLDRKMLARPESPYQKISCDALQRMDA
jgi:hypothetical protein